MSEPSNELVPGRESLTAFTWKTLRLILLSFALSSFHFISSAQEVSAAKSVLVINGFPKDTVFPELEPMKSSLRAHLAVPVDFYLEYLDTRRFNNPVYRKSLSETISQAYAETKPDLLIVGSYDALRFVIDYRQQLFPDVPIVFVAVDRSRLQELKPFPDVTGVTETVDIPGSVDLALGFHPDTRNIAIISGTSAFEKYWLGQFREEIRRHYGTMKLIEFSGLSAQSTLNQVSALPSHTIIFAQIMSEDSAEPVLNTFDLISAVSQRFPTYSVFNYCMAYGCIGGSYANEEQNGRMAGEIAARVLSGEKANDIPIQPGTRNRLVIDWEQLHRWSVSEALIPPGTKVLNRPPGIWEHYKKYMVAAVVVIAIQFLLILALLWQRERKRKAEAVLRESEKRFRVMADTTPSLIWMCDDKGKITYLNEQRVSFTGSDPHAGYGDTWREYIHPDDLRNILDTFSRALKSRQPFANQYRLCRQDGIYRWVFDVASPRVNGDGSFAGFIGSAVDVTDQKLAQESLEKVSGQLIAAQEKERSHLARELHDDICQRLAMLSLRIEKATKGLGSGQKQMSEQFQQIWQQCSSLTADVQALSHELHPSILDNLGLVTAVRSFCREVSEQNGAVVEFAEKDIPSSLPREVSLSLFRVIQEALHNAVKYSGQKLFKVHLKGNADQIELEVSDQGAGFDAESMKNGRGLGLVSMAERIHLLNGSIIIDSKPNIGTTIHASVPLAAQTKALAASAS